MLDIRVSGDTILLSGRFDSSQVEKAERVFTELVKSTAVDLSGLDYLSSAGSHQHRDARARMRTA